MLGFTNAYLLDAGDGLVIVDTGTVGALRPIVTGIRDAGRTTSDVRHITLTHAHFDHAGTVARLATMTGAQVWVHEADAPAIWSGRTAPLPTFEPRLIAAVMRRLPSPGFRAWQEAQAFADGASIAGDLRAIHNPGHTPGHTAYLWPAHGGVLFTGDTLTNFGRVRLGFFNGDWPMTKVAARQLAALDFDSVVFGHGPPIVGRAVARVRRDVERIAG
ncbi:MAG: MBL fold metallo-hydrolase [Chloroflexi bacterium]|nr:MBL fold metallo-hydrolase [Chloroflexota bacterium]